MILKYPDLSRKIALVTGGSSGIGQSIAYALAGAGVSVVAVGRNADALSAMECPGTTESGQIGSLVADLSELKAIPSIARLASNLFGPIHILVNAAGINLRESSDEVTVESWEKTLRINLSAPYFLARELVPAMKSLGGGKVINISSLQSRRAFPDSIAYGASKGGIDQLTRAMAEEWSRYGICCNAIAPGFFPTALTAGLFEDDNKIQSLGQQTACGRNGVLSDIQGPALFLASSGSDYVTGQTLFVDGGFTAK